jgi:uncharacterized repeat protein (TIGR03803 family)
VKTTVLRLLPAGIIHTAGTPAAETKIGKRSRPAWSAVRQLWISLALRKRGVCALVLASLLSTLRLGATPVLTNLVSFNWTNGAFPYAGLLQASNGNFYGTASAGGASGNGTVFVLSPSGLLTNLVSFDGITNDVPYAGLIQGPGGNLYGTTFGNPSSSGSVFEISPSGRLTTLTTSFGIGYEPNASLVEDTNGNFYGTTTSDENAGYGTVFSITPSGTPSTLAVFDNTNGASPEANLIIGNDGNLYGTTSSGGAYGLGGIFRVSLTGVLTNLASFDGTNGANPYAGLIQANDGNFYGTAPAGGAYNLGTVFQMTPSGLLTNLADFDGTNGATPYAPLLQAADGNFYGTTSGQSSQIDIFGTVFRMTASGALSTLVAFDNLHGANPYAGVIQGSDGALYGTTEQGGDSAMGTVYRVAEPLYFTSQPAIQNLVAGANAMFHAAASGGFAPVNYQWQKDSSPLADSARISGATSDTLVISNVSSADEGTYSLVVSNTFGDMAVSSNAVLEVVHPNPTVSIVSPSPEAILTSLNLIVSGTANDTVPVTAVYYQLNGSAWTLASTNNGWTNWSANLMLSPGTNVFSVYCQDSGGYVSPTNTQTYVPSALVTVSVQGSGSIAPNLDGQYLPLGSTWTLSAIPALGYVFSNWTGSIVAGAPSLTFQVESNLYLQADFTPGIFLPIKGTYNGLFYPSNNVSPSNSGSLTLTMTARGNFTAKARFADGQTTFVGQFSNGVASVKGIPPGAELATLALDLQLTGSQGTEQITGTLSGFNFNAAVSAYPAGKGPETAPQGQKLYTLVVPGGTNAALAPAGSGALTARLDAQGVFSLIGTLGDGSKVSQAMLAPTNGSFPFFVPANGGKGMLMGWLDLSGGAPQGQNLLWIKPAGLKNQRYYPGGFTLTTSATGSPYAKPSPGANVLALSNAILVLQGGNLSNGPLTNSLTLVKNKALFQSKTPGLALTFNPANGTFSGTCKLPGAKQPTALTGVALQQQNIATGLFLGDNESGQLMLFGD